MNAPFPFVTQALAYQSLTIDQRRNPNALFFEKGLHLDVSNVEAILPCEFLNLDCVDHLIDRILKTRHEQITNKMINHQ